MNARDIARFIERVNCFSFRAKFFFKVRGKTLAYVQLFNLLHALLDIIGAQPTFSSLYRLRSHIQPFSYFLITCFNY